MKLTYDTEVFLRARPDAERQRAKLLAHLNVEAKKFERRVRTVRVWRFKLSDLIEGLDVDLRTGISGPIGMLDDEEIDWCVNLDDNHDFDSKSQESEGCTTPISVGPIVTP